jgi:TonB family protein
VSPAQLAFSSAVHVTVVVAALLIKVTPAPGPESFPSRPTAEQQVRHLVFLAPPLPSPGGGGGGGGNEQPGPIRRAEDVGSDAVTLRVRKPPPTKVPTRIAAQSAVEIPSIVLDAKPLASGFFDQVGLPTAALSSGTSTGPGSGGGVGTGTGSGIGPGIGPGLGPGSGGGTGGGVYRAGGAVSAPRLLTQVRPRYTGAAMRNKIQGTVVLEAVVTSDGCASQIRIVKSLDRGLDEEAIAAVLQWRFEPGRLASGEAVDVLVTIMLDFTLR